MKVQHLGGNSTLEEMLAWMRERGWTVGCHNDYFQDGYLHSFWLFTHREGRFVKSEGHGDDQRAIVSACIRQVDDPSAPS